MADKTRYSPKRGVFRPGVRLDTGDVTDMRGRSAMRIGGRRLRKRGNEVGGTWIAIPRIRPVNVKEPSIIRQGVRNDHTTEGRARVRRVLSNRLRSFGAAR